MMQSEISGFLSISGIPAGLKHEVSKSLELPEWHEGDQKKPERVTKNWIYKTKLSSRLRNCTLDECISELIERPIKQAEKFSGLCGNFNRKLVITFFSDDDRPSFELSSENLQKMSRLGLSLRVAGYFGE